MGRRLDKFRILGSEVDQDLDVQGLAGGALDRRLFVELLVLGPLHRAGGDGGLNFFVAVGQNRFRVPIEGADAFRPVFHQQIDMVLAFPQIEQSAQDGLALGSLREASAR